MLLQEMLQSVDMTMNLYCHVTDDTLFAEMEKFEAWSQTDTDYSNGVKVVYNLKTISKKHYFLRFLSHN